MTFQLSASGQFPGDTDGSQHAQFAAKVQAVFGTLTSDQLSTFAMTISEPVIVVPADAKNPTPPVPAPVIPTTPPAQTTQPSP